MSKLFALFTALPLAACTTSSSPTLAELGDARVQVVTTPGNNVIDSTFPYVTTVFIRGTNGDCTIVGPDVTAEIDGVAMKNAYNDRAPGDVIDSPDCNLARFEVQNAPTTRGTSTVTIHDATATWTITGDNMFANDFAVVGTPVEGAHAHVMWTDGGPIDAGAAAQLWQTPGNGAITLDVAAHDNELDVRLPRGVSGESKLAVNAARTIAPARCEGPGSCGITLVGTEMLDVTIAPAPAAKPGAATIRELPPAKPGVTTSEEELGSLPDAKPGVTATGSIESLLPLAKPGVDALGY